jgi:hypothetical protein
MSRAVPSTRRPMALPLMLCIYFRFRRHSGNDLTCYRLDPVANDPFRRSNLKSSSTDGPSQFRYLELLQARCSLRPAITSRIGPPHIFSQSDAILTVLKRRSHQSPASGLVNDAHLRQFRSQRADYPADANEWLEPLTVGFGA